MGLSGYKPKVAAFKFLTHDLVDILASDAHSYNYRLEEMLIGLNAALVIKSKEEIDALINIVPQMVINNEDIANIKSVRKKVI